MYLGCIKQNNYDLHINLKNLKNPYSVYIPILNNGIVKDMYFINENSIVKYLYNWYVNNMYFNLDNMHRIKSFLSWIDTLPNFNYSNWRVVVIHLYNKKMIS